MSVRVHARARTHTRARAPFRHVPVLLLHLFKRARVAERHAEAGVVNVTGARHLGGPRRRSPYTIVLANCARPRGQARLPMPRATDETPPPASQPARRLAARAVSDACTSLVTCARCHDAVYAQQHVWAPTCTQRSAQPAVVLVGGGGTWGETGARARWVGTAAGA
jgi:hypothetical protein